MFWRVLLAFSSTIFCAFASKSAFLPEITQNETQEEIASVFLSHFEIYQQDHYRRYSRLLESINPHLVRTNFDRQCLEQLQFALQNPLNHQWTSKLLDSSGSLMSPGLFSETYTSFGDFDACLAIDGQFISENETQSMQVGGKHCFATVRLPIDAANPIDYRYSSFLTTQSNASWRASLAKRWSEVNVRFPIAHSLCLPSVCRASFIRDLILDAYKPLNLLDVNVGYCQTSESIHPKIAYWSPALIFVCTVLGFVSLLLAIGTFLDIRTTPSEKVQLLNEQSLCHRLLTSFSLVANGRDLFSPHRSSKYEWLDGVRCFFSAFALVSHASVNQSVLQFIPMSPIAHYPDVYIQQSSSLPTRYLVNNTFALKVHLLISGFLLSVNCLEKRRSLPSFARYFLSRWIRFTPTLIGYITFTLGLSFLGSGPLFHVKLIDPYIRPCLDSLWMQLLYINNWFNFRYSCGFQTWYISADLQLYLLAYLVLYFLTRQQWRNTYLACFFFIFLSYLISFVIFASGFQGIPSFLSALFPQLPIADRGYLIFWTATYNHLEAYFAGILLGTVVARGIYLKLSETCISVFWNVALFLLAILPLFYPWFLRNDTTKSLLDLSDNHSWANALFMTTFHGLIILCFSWLFYSASMYRSQLKSNLLLRLLSASIFAPLARLCFCVYLVHVPLIWYILHSARYPQIRNQFSATQFVILVYANSLAAAVLLHLCFEAPFSKATHTLFSWYDGKKKVKAGKTIQMKSNIIHSVSK